MRSAAISELDALSVLDKLSDDYEQRFGLAPFHLSHWDSSAQIAQAMLEHLRLPPPALPSPYIYPYELGLQSRLIKRLGLEPKERDCLVVPNGTNAMLFAAWWLKTLALERVIILCPSYFPAFYACEMVGLRFVSLHMRRFGGEWHFPEDELKRLTGGDGKTAVWITNPVYCTGFYLSGGDASIITSLLDAGVTVVLDECLAINGKEIARHILSRGGLLGLYSPHKAVCMNAIKFAALVYHSSHQQFFDHWADVIVGGLGTSVLSALQHFLGTSFAEFQAAFLGKLVAPRREIEQAVREATPSIEIDHNSEGYFLTCYTPRLAAEGTDAEWLRRLVFSTGAIVIPGHRNHFPRETGFNFRINLARDCPEFRGAARRTIRYLRDQSLGEKLEANHH